MQRFEEQSEKNRPLPDRIEDNAVMVTDPESERSGVGSTALTFGGIVFILAIVFYGINIQREPATAPDGSATASISAPRGDAQTPENAKAQQNAQDNARGKTAAPSKDAPNQQHANQPAAGGNAPTTTGQAPESARDAEPPSKQPGESANDTTPRQTQPAPTGPNAAPPQGSASKP